MNRTGAGRRAETYTEANLKKNKERTGLGMVWIDHCLF